MGTLVGETDRALVLEHAPPATAVRSLAKRSIDVVGAAVLLLVTAPILLLAMAIVRLGGGGPAIFVQRRVGYRCREFDMYKIRTMIDGAEELEGELEDRLEGKTFFKLGDDPRVTSVGRFLRKYSVDELPQLVNVLKGEMSLVGPRPLLPGDLRRFPRGRQRRRFSTKPGLTGLWQVSGRSRCSDRERMELDVRYVDEWDLAVDLKILLRTVPAVLRAEGAT